jgi:hypothetical protein
MRTCVRGRFLLVVAVLSPSVAGSPAWDRDRTFDAYGERVAEATGQRNAADAAVVALVAECLEAEWWQAQGTSSPEHWCQAAVASVASVHRRTERIGDRRGLRRGRARGWSQ